MELINNPHDKLFKETVIYHGRERWEIGVKLSDLMAETLDVLKRYISDYEYILYDLSGCADEEIKGGIKLRLFLELLINIFRENFPEKLTLGIA